MLEKIEHIEGLTGWDDHELKDDTPTNAMLVHFDVVAEEMPFLTQNNPNGTVVYQNFVYIFKEKHLGNFAMTRRIRDQVKWNEEDQKWEVVRLHKTHSDIRRYTNEWNAFFRNSKEGGDVGTPLSLLFRTDPSRIAHYSRFKINTVERLAALPEMDAQQLGMGAGDDIKRAQNYLARAKERAPMIEMENKFAEKDSQIAALLQSQAESNAMIADLSGKLRELLSERPVVAATRVKTGGRKKKIDTSKDSEIEGLE